MCYDIHYILCHHITPQAGENGVKNGVKRQEKEKKREAAKEREMTGTNHTDKGMAVHAVARKKRKTVIMQSWERAAFVPP